MGKASPVGDVPAQDVSPVSVGPALGVSPVSVVPALGVSPAGIVPAQGVSPADVVPAQGVQADRKDATSVIPDSSTRAVHGAGRFTLLPEHPALLAACCLYER